MEEEKKGFFAKVLDKTGVSKKIEEDKQRKEFEDQMRKEALEEAKPQIKEALKKQYIEEAVSKASKPKKSFLEKLSDGFKASEGGSNKIEKMLGSRTTGFETKSSGLGSVGSSEKISQMLGKTPQVKTQEEDEDLKKKREERLKNLLR